MNALSVTYRKICSILHQLRNRKVNEKHFLITINRFSLKRSIFTEWNDCSFMYLYNEQDATSYRSIYFCKLLYMFQTVSPPIIRSTKLYIQRQVLSNQYCYLLQQAAVLVWQYLTLYVQFCALDDGRRNRLKHVEQFIKINRSIKCCILLVVLWRYTCDALTYERQSSCMSLILWC